MIEKIQESLWQQFGAGIDMLLNVVASSPEHYFEKNTRFYHLLFHSIIFLDYYLSIPPTDFSTGLPFTITNKNNRPPEAIGNIVPNSIYSRQALIDFLKDSRLKCKKLIEGLTEQQILGTRFTEGNKEGDMDYPVLEILLYNMRHTQHHIGQLNLMLRQHQDAHMPWVFRANN